MKTQYEQLQEYLEKYEFYKATAYAVSDGMCWGCRLHDRKDHGMPSDSCTNKVCWRECERILKAGPVRKTEEQLSLF